MEPSYMKLYVKNTKTNKVEKVVTRRLTKSDLGELMNIQAEAMASLGDKSLCIESSREDFEKIIDGRGEMHGIFTRDTLCGVCGVYMPGDIPENLGHDIELPKSELDACAVIDGIFVSSDYRQNGIARELVRICIKRAVDVLGARYVLAAVSPKNTPCILSFMSINGMRLSALRQKYGCKLRYIMCYNHDDKRLYTVYERYALGDVYSISRALADGYVGIATFKNDEKVYIWMSK
jgi:ribosomal protein S18 acetylase RimI-like enzyme